MYKILENIQPRFTALFVGLVVMAMLALGRDTDKQGRLSRGDDDHQQTVLTKTSLLNP